MAYTRFPTNRQGNQRGSRRDGLCVRPAHGSPFLGRRRRPPKAIANGTTGQARQTARVACSCISQNFKERRARAAQSD